MPGLGTVSAGLKRVGTLKRISASTLFPAPGAGLLLAAYDFKLSFGGLTPTALFEVSSPDGTVIYRISAVAIAELGRNRFMYPGPVITATNTAMRVNFTNQVAPWSCEFFLVTQPA